MLIRAPRKPLCMKWSPTMFARTLGCTVLGLAVLCYGTEVGAGGKDVKDKVVKDAKDKEEPKRGEIPKGAIAGKMKSVNLKEKSFTIVLESGKDRSFDVTKETKFIGPRGGLSEEGLKD